MGIYVCNRQEACPETNTWIVKPWNKSRSIDVVVSHDNLPHVLRMMDTGPKVRTLNQPDALAHQ